MSKGQFNWGGCLQKGNEDVRHSFIKTENTEKRIDSKNYNSNWRDKRVILIWHTSVEYMSLNELKVL